MGAQGFLELKSEFKEGEGMWWLVLRDVNSKRGESLFARSFPHLLPYFEGSNRAAGCQVQVLS